MQHLLMRYPEKTKFKQLPQLFHQIYKEQLLLLLLLYQTLFTKTLVDKK